MCRQAAHLDLLRASVLQQTQPFVAHRAGRSVHMDAAQAQRVDRQQRGDQSGIRPACQRLRRFGPNDTGEGRKRGWLGAVKTVAGEPMFLLLLAAAGVYLAVGDLGEGLLLGFFAVVSVGLVILQQHRGEEALDALRALAVPQARVIRGGVTQRIPSLEVVPGDLVVLSEGERIPADGVLREALAVQVDESLLTG